MAHIKKINEMAGNYTLKGLLLGYEEEGKYAMTVYGFQAIYQTLYSDDEVNGAVDFCVYASEKPNIDEESIFDYLCEFIFDKLVDDATDEKIINTIYNGDHLNYLSSRCEMFREFDNSQYTQWASKVADLLGIELEYDED